MENKESNRFPFSQLCCGDNSLHQKVLPAANQRQDEQEAHHCFHTTDIDGHFTVMWLLLSYGIYSLLKICYNVTYTYILTIIDY